MGCGPTTARQCHGDGLLLSTQETGKPRQRPDRARPPERPDDGRDDALDAPTRRRGRFRRARDGRGVVDTRARFVEPLGSFLRQAPHTPLRCDEGLQPGRDRQAPPRVRALSTRARARGRFSAQQPRGIARDAQEAHHAAPRPQTGSRHVEDSAQRLTFLQLHTPSMWPTARDKDGCPVVYTNVEQYACRGASSRAVEQTFVWILETVCNELDEEEGLGDHRGRFTILLDLTRCPHVHLPAFCKLGEILQRALKRGFRGRLNRFYIYPTGRRGRVLLRVIKPFLGKYTPPKIEMIPRENLDRLTEIFPREILPEHLGGTSRLLTVAFADSSPSRSVEGAEAAAAPQPPRTRRRRRRHDVIERDAERDRGRPRRSPLVSEGTLGQLQRVGGHDGVFRAFWCVVSREGGAEATTTAHVGEACRPGAAERGGVASRGVHGVRDSVQRRVVGGCDGAVRGVAISEDGGRGVSEEGERSAREA